LATLYICSFISVHGFSLAQCSKERKTSKIRAPDSKENIKFKKLKLFQFHNIPTTAETLNVKQAQKMPFFTKDLS
jgi:hypothetical protein